MFTAAIREQPREQHRNDDFISNENILVCQVCPAARQEFMTAYPGAEVMTITRENFTDFIRAPVA